MVEEAGADEGAEGSLTQLDGAADEVDRPDPVLAVRAHVVADDEGSVRPAHEHRPVEPQLVDDPRDVVGPQLIDGVVLGLQWGFGHAMTAQITGDQPEPVGQRAPILLGPAQVVLRPAVEEQDRRRIRVPPLTHVQLQPAAAQHGACDHPLRHRRHRQLLFGSWTPMVARLRAGSASGIGPYFAGPGPIVHHVGICRILAAWRLARARSTWGAHASSSCSSGPSRRHGRARVAPRPSQARPGSGRPGWPAELGRCARDDGFEVLVGRSIDLVGTELPYQPFVEAVRPLGEVGTRGRIATAGVREGPRAAR